MTTTDVTSRSWSHLRLYVRTRLGGIAAGNSCNHLSQDNPVAHLTINMPASIASSQVQTTRSVVWNQGKSPSLTTKHEILPRSRADSHFRKRFSRRR
jgi:hypothetical protein